MKNFKYTWLIALFGWVAITHQAVGQGSSTYEAGIKLNVDEEGEKFVRLITWHQFWGSYTENNPGSFDVNGEPSSDDFDFGIRRSRFLAFTQISDRFMILTHWGINNQSFTNGGLQGADPQSQLSANKKPQLFIHDAWVEYTIVPKILNIGTGLHYWNGISRMTNASTLNFMTVDAPIFNWATIEATDQFARQMGIYAKGKIGKVDYRLSLNKPFRSGSRVDSLPADGVSRNVVNDNWSNAGYIAYQFWDQESNYLPYAVGSYLGTKKVLNIGAGWHYHPGSVGKREVGDANGERSDMTLFGVDLFMDLPFANTSSLTLYSVFYNYDFGDSYLRNIGILNTAAGGTTLAGGGNRQPTIGTGNIFYTQVGYLLPENVLGEGNGKLQPFAAITYKDFDALEETSLQGDFGFNYLLDGHHAKVTLQYSTRPIYDATTRELSDEQSSAGQLILQTMIYL